MASDLSEVFNPAPGMVARESDGRRAPASEECRDPANYVARAQYRNANLSAEGTASPPARGLADNCSASIATICTGPVRARFSDKKASARPTAGEHGLAKGQSGSRYLKTLLSRRPVICSTHFQRSRTVSHNTVLNWSWQRRGSLDRSRRSKKLLPRPFPGAAPSIKGGSRRSFALSRPNSVGHKCGG